MHTANLIYEDIVQEFNSDIILQNMYWLSRTLFINSKLVIQHTVQVGYVADCQSQDFYLGQLLVRRKRWQ